jgi:DNA-binding HxlR family transcriptional regulator
MRRKSFEDMRCPIARSLERVGEWWSILILRDAFQGLTRFHEFQESLGIATNMLARRLQSLVEGGLLERRQCQKRPERFEYVLTERGRDFREVLFALVAWGNKHLAPEGPSIVYVDRETSAVADPVVVDRVSGRPLSDPSFRVAAGPAADERTRRLVEEVERRAAAAARRAAQILPRSIDADAGRGRPRRVATKTRAAAAGATRRGPAGPRGARTTC